MPCSSSALPAGLGWRRPPERRSGEDRRQRTGDWSSRRNPRASGRGLASPIVIDRVKIFAAKIYMYNDRHNASRYVLRTRSICITCSIDMRYTTYFMYNGPISGVIHVDRVRYTYRSSPLYISGDVMHIVTHIDFRREYINTVCHNGTS